MAIEERDVVVVGGGSIGVAAAYYAARAGLSVTLVEAGGPLGLGTSVASIGAINMLTKKPGDYLRLARASAKMFPALQEELSADFEYECRGGLLVAETQAEADYLAYLSERQREMGIPVELWSPEQACSREPMLSRNILSASYTPTEGLVNPLLLVQAFRDGAKRLGARFLYRSRVTGIGLRNGRMCSVYIDQGEIRCQWLVNAAGVHCRAVARMIGLDHSVTPVRGQVLVTEPMPRPVQGIVMSAGYVLAKHRPDLAPKEDALGVGLVCRPTHSGSLLIGVTQERGIDDTSTTGDALQAIARRIIRLLPTLGRASLIRSFSGVRPSSDTGFPIVRAEPDIPGYLVASGHAGDGIALAPVTGLYLVELMTGSPHLVPDLSAIFLRLSQLAAAPAT